MSDIVNHYDYHATLLRQFGIDHEQLTYKRAGQEQTLTDGQKARVVKELWHERLFQPPTISYPQHHGHR